MQSVRIRVVCARFFCLCAARSSYAPTFPPRTRKSPPAYSPSPHITHSPKRRRPPPPALPAKHRFRSVSPPHTRIACRRSFQSDFPVSLIISFDIYIYIYLHISSDYVMIFLVKTSTYERLFLFSTSLFLCPHFRLQCP